MSGRVVVAGGVAVERFVRYDAPALPGGTRTAHSVALAVAGTAAVAALAAAEAGAEVRCLSAIGTDPAGAVVRQRLARADIDVRTVTLLQGETARILRPFVPSHAGAGGPGWFDGFAAGSGRGFGAEPPAESPIRLPGVAWGLGTARPAEALAGCTPGDALLIDAAALLDAGGQALVEAAYGADLQVVALLTPYPESSPEAVAAGVDVVVADQAAAAALADAGYLPRSLCVVVGAAGLSWDGETFLAPEAGWTGGMAPVGLPEHGYAVLAGALAARLALGDDRPEAAAAALAAAQAVAARAMPYPDLRLHEEDLG